MATSAHTVDGKETVAVDITLIPDEVKSDSEVMTTTKDLHDVLVTYDVLETFNRLPREDQDRFFRWIGAARDDDSYWMRVEALVLALRVGPLQEIKLEDSVGDTGSRLSTT